MPDDLKRKGPEDTKKININQKHEIEYWSTRFGVTKEQLIKAVKKVGPLVKKVEQYLLDLKGV